MGKEGRKKWKWLLASCLLLVLLSVALLPTFLFSTIGLNFFLPRLNTVINGTLAITSCAGGWTKGLSCEEVQFTTADDQTLFSAKHIALDRSLFKLLMAPRNVGVVSIDSPVIRIPVPAATTIAQSKTEISQTDTPVAKDQLPQPSAKNANKEAISPSGKKKPFWEGLIAGLQVIQGQVISPLITPDHQSLAEDISLQARLSDGTVKYALQLRSGEQHGRVSAQGFFNLPIYNQPLLPALVSSTELEITNLEMAGFLEALAAGQPTGVHFPTGHGVLNGKWQVKTAGLHNIVVQGRSTLDDFALTGGLLGTDHPTFQQVELVIDGARKSATEWAIDTLRLDSKLLSVQSSGLLHDSEGEVRASGKLQLPALFTMFPHSLKVKNDVTVAEGELDFDLVVEKTDGINKIFADVRSSILQGAFKKQPILWEEPFSLSAEINQEQKSGSLSFPKVHLATDFLALQGHGSVDNFSLHGTADLHKAFKAVGTFVDTTYQASGQVEFDSSSMILQDQRYQVDTTLNIKKFAVGDGDGNIIPDYPLQLSARGIAPSSWFTGKGGLDVDISTNSWLGKGRVQLFDMQREGTQSANNWLNGGYAVNASLALEPLTTFINRIRPAKEPFFAKGAASVTVSGKTEPHVLKIGQLDLDIRDVELHYQDVGYQDQQVRFTLLGQIPEPSNVPVTVHPLKVHDTWKEYGLSGQKSWATFDLVQHQMVLPHLFFDSGIFSIPSATLYVADWQSPLNTFTLDFAAAFAVDNVVDVMHQMDRLPDTINGKGKAVVSGKVSGRAKQLEADLQLEGQELAYLYDKKIITDNQQLNAKIKLQHAVGTKNVELANISLQSQGLSWDGKAAFRGGDTANIYVDGKAVPDFVFLAKLLSAATGKQYILTGHNTQNIAANISLSKDGGKVDPLTLHYQGGIDGIQYQGITVSELALSSSIEKGKGRLGAAGNLNEGTISFSPLYDTTGETASLSLLEPEMVLSAVHLQEPLVKNVLAKMHPLFGVLVRPKGVISMRADSFFVPVAQAEKARFQAVFDVEQVQLESNVFLREILALVNVADDALDLKEAEITCTGEHGRVSCSPVHILTAESEMTLHGSAGYDGSLDYVLTLPVTKNLVGKEGYRLLEGTTIDIPIKGSVDEPLFSRENLQQTIAKIIKQAAASAVENQLQKVIPGLLENIFGN